MNYFDLINSYAVFNIMNLCKKLDGEDSANLLL